MDIIWLFDEDTDPETIEMEVDEAIQHMKFDDRLTEGLRLLELEGQ